MESAMGKDSSGKPNELSSGGSRYHQVYPTLDEKQLAILEGYGKRRKLKPNEILYSEGDRHTGSVLPVRSFGSAARSTQPDRAALLRALRSVGPLARHVCP